MVARYVKLHPELVKMVDEDINELLPSHSEHSELIEAHNEMQTLAVATKLLQGPEIDLLKSRTILDMVISKFPQMKPYLKKDAEIVVNDPVFESAIVKLLSGSNLTPSEKICMEPFKNSIDIHAIDEEDNDANDAEPDLAKEFLMELQEKERKRRKIETYT
jgi:hypothetical protein